MKVNGHCFALQMILSGHTGAHLFAECIYQVALEEVAMDGQTHLAHGHRREERENTLLLLIGEYFCCQCRQDSDAIAGCNESHDGFQAACFVVQATHPAVPEFTQIHNLGSQTVPFFQQKQLPRINILGQQIRLVETVRGIDQ